MQYNEIGFTRVCKASTLCVKVVHESRRMRYLKHFLALQVMLLRGNRYYHEELNERVLG